MTIIEDLSDEEIISELTIWLQAYSDNPVLVLASGGSSARLFAEAWKRLDNTHIANIVLSLADERFGTPDHDNSNWKLLRGLGVDVDNQRHIPVNTGKLTLEETAQAWESQIDKVINSGIPVISLMGIGDDSHIAGIKPKSPSASEHRRYVSAYTWTDFDRVTITPALIRKITSARVYASGANKRPAITLLLKDLKPVAYPSQYLKEIDDCTLYYQA